ncbi:hypothetical protein AK812_SmicGene11770 [Symbiodinium microadriaticum]|uniref:Uncharacterized protein n=1 Tax=Symbiodinium microadriaticum TaxID=2951 RepID=A0A1Q9ECE1_SYMMI|nr:hypothetical protein AK812_SmicGene11770 [Symbiodinium microadriaticum]
MQNAGLTQRLEEAKLRSAHFLCVTKRHQAAVAAGIARKQILKAAEELKHQQEYYQFFDHDGNISGYSGTTRKDVAQADKQEVGEQDEEEVIGFDFLGIVASRSAWRAEMTAPLSSLDVEYVDASPSAPQLEGRHAQDTPTAGTFGLLCMS